MAKRERALNVLLVDDQVDKMIEFRALAKKNRVIISKTFKSAENALKELNNNTSKYDAVILDAKAFRKENQEAGTETFKALRDAINGIKALERKTDRTLPYCVYTGHIETMGEAWEDDLKIFVKGRDQEKLFDYLKEQVKNLPETTIIHQHFEVFQLFDQKLLDTKYKEKLLYILKKQSTQKQEELEELLGHIRKILEGLYKELGENGRIDKDLIPNGRPNLEYCQRYLAGLDINGFSNVPNAITPSHISWSLKIVKENASAAGAHDYKDSLENYSLKAMINALLDVLLWYKKFMLDNHS